MTIRRLRLEDLESRQLLSGFAGPGPGGGPRGGRPGRPDPDPQRPVQAAIQPDAPEPVQRNDQVALPDARGRAPQALEGAGPLAAPPRFVVNSIPGSTQPPAMRVPVLPPLVRLPFGGFGETTSPSHKSVEAVPEATRELPQPAEERPTPALPGPESAGLLDRVAADLDAVFRKLAECGPGDPASLWRYAAWTCWVLGAAGACAAARRDRRDRELAEVES
jgi:hypothetical protein